jgi:glycosyltransferase involved in cell wall biosynthesis
VTRPRVVHVVVAGEIGGAERMLVDLATRADASGADHVVALMTPIDALARLFEGAGLVVRDRGRVRENPAAYLWRSLGPVDTAWLERVLRAERASVAHLHTFASHVVGTRAAQGAGVPIVRTEHSTRAYNDPSCWPFSRWSLRRSQQVVAVSRHIQSVALTRAPWIRRMTVIHNGVDTERFAPRESPGGARRPHDTRPLRFSLVARLERRKGVDLAIEALAHVPEATLDVVGDGDDRATLEARARRLEGRVKFHGELADVRDVHAACDVVLCSSRQEGLGIAVIEGMAMGKPVVAFPVGGVPEVVDHGVTGWLADSSSAEALAAAMREAVARRDRLDAMGEAARTRVLDAFSIDAMCRSYGEVYAKVCARG